VWSLKIGQKKKESLFYFSFCLNPKTQVHLFFLLFKSAVHNRSLFTTHTQKKKKFIALNYYITTRPLKNNVAMILGIGHDIVHLPRFVTFLRTRSARRVKRLAQRVLHPVYEQPQFNAAFAAAKSEENNTPSNELVRAAHLLANAWACKEALYKALDETDQPHCQFNAWYKHKLNNNNKTNSTSGKPAIACDAYAATHPAETFWLSVSHDGDYLTAFVVREGK
jgi:phosphopantetheine--protein transferase-like protein